jgi:hypothetical protein
VRGVLAAGLAPRLELLSPAEAASDGDYELKVGIKPRSGGLGSVEVTINGARVDSRTAPTGGMLTQRLPLAPGRNEITSRAYTRDGKVASEPVTAVVVVRPSGKRPALHVLAVGISDYDDGKFATPGIRFAARDAQAFAAKLREGGQGLYESFDITVLSKPGEVKLARIERALRELGARSRPRPQDVAVVYLAGHGRALDGKYHFIPGDLVFENNDSLRKRSLTQAKLEKHLEDLGVGKVLLVIDTCHAGAMAQTRGAEEPFAIANLMQMTGRAILAATLPDQLAVQNESEGHGVFTGALLEGLDGKADTGRGYVNIDELANYVARVVPDRAAAVKNGVASGLRQRPMRQTKGEAFDLVRTRR